MFIKDIIDLSVIFSIQEERFIKVIKKILKRDVFKKDLKFQERIKKGKYSFGDSFFQKIFRR